MIERGGGLGFAAETRERLRIFGDVVGKKFQRDETVQAGVFGFVDDAHATATKFFDHTIVGYRLANE